MLDSDIEIRFNFRQLKFKWKTVFHLKNETQALVVKQIFIKLKWGESKGAGFERARAGSASPWLRLLGSRNPADERLIFPAIN